MEESLVGTIEFQHLWSPENRTFFFSANGFPEGMDFKIHQCCGGQSICQHFADFGDFDASYTEYFLKV